MWDRNVLLAVMIREEQTGNDYTENVEVMIYRKPYKIQLVNSQK